MVTLNVELLKRINNVEFGMKREMVRKKFGNLVGVLKKSELSDSLVDDFGFCYVFYNDEDEFEGIEVLENAEAYIDGKIIFPRTIEDIKNIIDDLEEEDGYYVSESKSVWFFAPSGKPERIFFGTKGYYK